MAQTELWVAEFYRKEREQRVATKKTGNGFKAELKVKALPAAAEEYAKQYFINLMLQGYTLLAPASEGGKVMNAENVEAALEAWNKAKGTTYRSTQ